MRAVVFSAVFVLAVTLTVVVLDLPWWVAGLVAVLTAAILAAYFGVKHVVARRAAGSLERALFQQAGEASARARPDQQGEIAELAREFQSAVETLKSSKLGKGRGSALYALPWYVIIGPPGAGKSTALRNSGLTFPQLRGQPASVRGIGGTRNCEWWLSNEAVILDTAGRYTTDDADRDEWLSFLELLKRHRSSRPVNGVIVAVSVADVAGATEDQLDALASRVRERLDEVVGKLGVLVPVYVLFTKCDLLPGFVESFGDLRRTERQQVFGFTLPAARAVPIADDLHGRFERLLASVEARALVRAGEERRVEARERIHRFPEELLAIRSSLVALVTRVFAENVYREVPVLRGVYLTSGTQEGRPIDRVMNAMAEAFGRAVASPESEPVVEAKSYFLGDVFTRVMFEDHDLGAFSHASERAKRSLRWLTALGLSLFAIVVVSAAGGSYVKNRRLLTTTRAAADTVVALSTTSTPTPEALAALAPLRDRVSMLRTYDANGAPFGMGFGLYRGAALRPHVEAVYARAIRRILVEPTVRELREGLLATAVRFEGGGAPLSAREHGAVYDELREYLVLTEPREAHEPPSDESLTEFVVSRVVGRWCARFHPAASPTERANVAEHVRTYLALERTDRDLAVRRDAYAVRRAREVLRSVSPAQIAVDRLVSRLEPLGWDVTLGSILGTTSTPITATGRVRGAFTRRAWDELLRDALTTEDRSLLGERWVLEASDRASTAADDRAQLCALRSQFYTRFIEEWKGFLAAIRVEEPADLRSSLALVQSLTRGEPAAFERILRSVAYHAELPLPAPTVIESATAAASDSVLARLEKRLAAGSSPGVAEGRPEPCAGEGYVHRADVAAALEGFYRFGVARPNGNEAEDASAAQLTPIRIYQEQLEFVRDALQTFVDDPTASDALLGRLQQARTEIRGLIEEREVGWRSRFDAMLWPPFAIATASSTSALAGERGTEWCTAVAVPFERSLRGRYPFERDGQDAALTDLAEFYRPSTGTVWRFYDATLAKDVRRVGDRFEPLSGEGVAGLYVAQLPTFLERSQSITNALFPSGKTEPRVEFEVRIRPTPGVASTELSVDGQRVAYRNGPEQWIRLAWPGEGDVRGAALRVRGAGLDEAIEQGGEWGLLRLFDAGTVAGAPRERFFSVTFHLRKQGLDVVLDVRPARSANPFVPLSSVAARFLAPFRASGVTAPRSITSGSRCSEH